MPIVGLGVPYRAGTNLRPLLPDSPVLAVKQLGPETGYLVALIGSGLDHHESSAMGSEEGQGLLGVGHATVKTGANERLSPGLQPGCGFRDIVRERMWLPGLVLQKRLVGRKT